MARQSYRRSDVDMPHKKAEPKDESLEFLLALDKKLHYVKPGTFKPNMSPGVTIPTSIDRYNDDIHMSVKEVRQLIQIVDDSLNYALIPINTCLGFAVGFAVYDMDKLKSGRRILAFKESQLPNRYNFDRMSEVFMTKHNLVKAKVLDLNIVNDREHYTY